jgi:hypothetical protein
MNTIELAKDAGFDTDLPSFKNGTAIALKLAALVRAEREWVDLTDDEILMCVKSQSIIETVRRAFVAFKEKQK